MSNNMLSINTLRVVKRFLLIQKQRDLKTEKNDNNIKEFLLLIFNKISKEGYTEISLNNEDIKEYIIELKKIFEELKIENPSFIKKNLDRSAINLKETIIQISYEEDYGCYDDETDKLYINIDGYTEHKDITRKSKDKKIIDTISKMIIKKNYHSQTKCKKLTNKNNS